MRPYGHIEAVMGGRRKVHGHNECDVCSGQPRSKTSTRMKLKRELHKEVNTI